MTDTQAAAVKRLAGRLGISPASIEVVREDITYHLPTCSCNLCHDPVTGQPRPVSSVYLSIKEES